jgi:hypothetical protein
MVLLVQRAPASTLQAENFFEHLGGRLSKKRLDAEKRLFIRVWGQNQTGKAACRAGLPAGTVLKN